MEDENMNYDIEYTYENKHYMVNTKGRCGMQRKSKKGGYYNISEKNSLSVHARS